MWPKDTEWKRWSSLNKATYVAQLLAPVALLVGSVFSYLTWYEARRAQELARQMFVAQNAPFLELESVTVETFNGDPAVVFRLTNTGESPAYSVCLQLFHVTASLHSACAEDEPDQFTVNMPAGTSYGLTYSTQSIANQIGVRATGVVAVPPAQATAYCPDGLEGELLIMEWTYRDTFGNEHDGGQRVRLCTSEVGEGNRDTHSFSAR